MRVRRWLWRSSLPSSEKGWNEHKGKAAGRLTKPRTVGRGRAPDKLVKRENREEKDRRVCTVSRIQ